jgi:hypothetical protein
VIAILIGLPAVGVTRYHHIQQARLTAQSLLDEGEAIRNHGTAEALPLGYYMQALPLFRKVGDNTEIARTLKRIDELRAIENEKPFFR